MHRQTAWLAFIFAVALILQPAEAGWRPGLRAGTLSGWNTASANPGNGDFFAPAQLGPYIATINDGNTWTNDTTYLYTGQVYFAGSSYTQSWSENCDDNMYLNIDGTTYLNDTTWNNATYSGPVTKPAGWYSIDMRMYDGTGGEGGVGAWGGKAIAFTNSNANSTSGDDYFYPQDPGNGSFFRYDDGYGDPTNAPYHLEIKAVGYSAGGTLTNFPLLVKLNNGVGNFTYASLASANGYDLRFTDTNNVHLYYETELWNSNDTSYLWVQVPSLSNNASIWMHWGNPGNLAQPAFTTNGQAWETGFRAVWHMQLSDSNLLDSAQHSLGRLNGVTQSTNNYPPTNAPGQIGNAISFESGHRSPYTNWIAVRSSSGQDTNVNLGVGGDHAYTLEAWLYVPDTNADNSAGGNGGYICYGDGGDNRQIALGLGANDPAISNGHISVNHWNDPVAVRQTKYTRDAWQHIVLTYAATGSIEKLYVNGQLKESWDPGVDYNFHSSAKLFFHASTFSWWAADGQYAGTNIMDETRFSTIDRGSNYQWATWYSTASNAQFVTYGAGMAGPPSISNTAASAVMATTATANANFLSSGGAATYLWVYYGTSDQGSNKSGWASSLSLGSGTVGAVSANLSGLSQLTSYNYRYYASNSAGDAWSPLATSFTTYGVPSMTNQAATSIATDGATLPANLLSTGGTPTYIWLYWGTNDGGVVKASWGNAMSVGPRAAGTFNMDMGGAMMENTLYYFTFYASNLVGESWGGTPPARSFTTLLSPGTDSDGDGMPDWWEIRFFGGATNGGSTANADGDPLSNYEEYLAGTLPSDSNSFLRIVGVTSIGGSNQLIWIGGTNGVGTPYRILSRTDLSSGNWTESGTQSRSEGSNVWGSTGTDPRRFYTISATN